MAKKPTKLTQAMKSTGSIMASGGIPKGNAPTPAPKGKKPSVKIDIMLAKAMPGVGMPKKSTNKTATKKGKC